MKKFASLLLFGSFLFGGMACALAQCPEDPNDHGVCDTLFVVCYDSVKIGAQPWYVHSNLLITNDVPNPEVDSIAAMMIPLRFDHSNPSAHCTLSSLNNNVDFDDPDNCIFRHCGGMQNRVMELYEDGNGAEWNTLMLDWDNNPMYGPSYLVLSMFPTGAEDQLWWEGTKTLLATITFTVDDTMTIRIDTTFLSVDIRLCFTRSDAVTYVPRDDMPYYVTIQSSDRGDANGDGQINVADAMYILNYLFRNGPPPVSSEAGDANCDGDCGVLDVVFLLNYLFRHGPSPLDACALGASSLLGLETFPASSSHQAASNRLPLAK
jgi:hypothetical protein